MFKKFFGKKVKPPVETPSIMGLRINGSFEIDPLLLKLNASEFIAQGIAPTQIIKSVGVVDLEGTILYRFYTDDDAFLQLIAEGGQAEENVVDVKLFHFYDTQDIQDQRVWDKLLNQRIGTLRYELEGHSFMRVWTAASDYHNPVHMIEKTYDSDGSFTETDQFTMLFERPLLDEQMEALFLSAEEVEHEGNLTRCFVLSTGLTLSPSQITIHG